MVDYVAGSGSSSPPDPNNRLNSSVSEDLKRGTNGIFALVEDALGISPLVIGAIVFGLVYIVAK